MAKPRHDEPNASSSKSAIIVMAAGTILVAALVIWALTRSVEPAAEPVAGQTAAIETAPPTATMPFTPTETTATVPPPTPPGDMKSIPRISAEDVRDQLGSGDLVIVDVRDATSYNRKHIAGAVHVPYASVGAAADTLPKDKLIVTYCTWPAEESSAGAALVLKQQGFQNVRALFGGLDAWERLGYPIESGS